MAQINDRFRSQEGAFFMFWCPGCGDSHSVPSGRGWTFNGDFNAPTVQPSLLVRAGHYAPHHVAGDPCWCTYNAEHPREGKVFSCYRCHSYITGGMIQFLADCTHDLAGKTVPIPPLPPHLRD